MSKIGDMIRNASELLLIPEIYDCASTKAAEVNGFEAVMISSGDLSCSLTGIPDLGLLSIDEYVAVTERITNMTDMPLINDIDAGFGRPINCYYGCKRMAKAGAAGVLVTDASENNLPGLATVKLARARVQAARDGFNDDDALIIARCDVNPVTDYEEFVERSNLYLESGANMICPAPWGVHGGGAEDLTALAKKIGEGVKGWLWWPDLSADPNGDPEVAVEDLFKYGFKMTGIHYSMHAAMLAMLDSGRHVFKDRNNVYVSKAYGFTGYKFMSSMAFYLKDNKWVDTEAKYVEDPEDSLSYRLKPIFCQESDIYDPDAE